jgi:hypothetical protein
MPTPRTAVSNSTVLHQTRLPDEPRFWLLKNIFTLSAFHNKEMRKSSDGGGDSRSKSITISSSPRRAHNDLQQQRHSPFRSSPIPSFDVLTSGSPSLAHVAPARAHWLPLSSLATARAH